MSNYSESVYSEDPNSSWFKALTYIAPKSTVLDVGCSSGNFGRALIVKKQCIVDGVELDSSDIKAASKDLRNVYQLNVEMDDLSVIPQQYDYIYFGDVIEHLVRPIETLKRIKQLLKANGVVVFSIPNMSHLAVRLMLLNGDFVYGETGLLDKTHLHFYTYHEVQRVFTESGYIISDLNPVVKDYPEEVVRDELKRVGLKVTPEFMGYTRTTEASVYQFVGMAKPTESKGSKTTKLDIVSPVDKFQTYLDDTRHYYENLLKSDKTHIRKLERNIQELSEEVADTQRRLQEVMNHPVVRLAGTVMRLRNHTR